jgi:hypothetical protein
MFADPKSVVLAVDGIIHAPDSGYFERLDSNRSRVLGKIKVTQLNTHCAGVIEATEEEMQILASAGYRLTDLRNVRVTELITSLSDG